MDWGAACGFLSGDLVYDKHAVFLTVDQSTKQVGLGVEMLKELASDQYHVDEKLKGAEISLLAKGQKVLALRTWVDLWLNASGAKAGPFPIACATAFTRLNTMETSEFSSVTPVTSLPAPEFAAPLTTALPHSPCRLMNECQKTL